MMANVIGDFNIFILLLLFFIVGSAARTKNEIYHQLFKVGESKTLNCFDNNGGENIKSDRLFEWSHNGLLIPASDQHLQQRQQQQPQHQQLLNRITFSRNKAQLKIENLAPLDSGEYACQEIVESANNDNTVTQRVIRIYNLKLGQ